MVDRYARFSLAISRIYHDIQKTERIEMERLGLKGPHAQVLLSLCRHPDGVTAGQLCEICAKDKAAISRSLSELENKGLVSRQTLFGSTYRALIKLTPEGEIAAQAVSERAVTAVEQAGQGLEEREREVFYQVLARIADNLHAIGTVGMDDIGEE